MKKITQVIDRYRMFGKGDPVVVGFSGGADSVMLTHFLHTHGMRVFAVHINHQLRGEESLRDEAFVSEFCKRYSIPCEIHRVDIGEEAIRLKVGTELAGREVRYRILGEAAKKHEAVIATAHTLSDQAETVLFRLARGSGLKGLSGIPAVRQGVDGVRIVRPLIAVSRREVEAYCRENGLSYVVDSSNLTDDYARNLIRNRVVPHLLAVNDAAERHIGETADIFAQEEDFLDIQAKSRYTECKTGSGLSANAVNRLHPAMQNRVIRLYLEEQGISVDRLLVQRVLQLCAKDDVAAIDKRYGAVSLPDGKECLLRGGRIFLKETDSEAIFPDLREFLSDKKSVFLMPSGQTWAFSLTDTKPIQNVHKNLYLFCLDYDKIEGKPVCRCRAPSDRICIAGRNITKTVKKWMNEEKVPMGLRDRLFVLADEQGVLAVEGLGISSRIAADETTKRWLVVSAVINE